MKKFIIGYHSDENVTEGLMQFKSKDDADWSSEEWCEVEAETLQEAFDKYEESFLAWKGEQSKLYPTKKKEVLHTQGEWKVIKHFISLPCIGVQNDELNVTIAIVQNDEGNEIAKANAELICKAVNERQKLIEVMNAAQNLIDCDGLRNFKRADAIYKLQTAINNAKNNT